MVEWRSDSSANVWAVRAPSHPASRGSPDVESTAEEGGGGGE